jgi:predicted porin
MKKILLTSTLIASTLFANNIPMANVYGSQGVVFPKDMLKMVIITDTFTKDTSYNGSDEVIDKKQRTMDMTIVKYKIRYGLGNNFDITIIPTYIKKELNYINPMNKKAYNSSNTGLGDTYIFTRYQLSNQKKGDALFSSLGFVIKLPTGDTSKKFITPKGIETTPTMQLGSGSTDYMIELGLSKLLGKINTRIDFSSLYTYTTNGDNNYEYGNRLVWNLGYSYALTNKFDIQVELDGKHFKKDISNNKEVASSGGNFYYITPGVHYKFNKTFNLSFAYAKMIKRDNNYDVTTKTGGLSEDSRYSLRAVYSF